MKLITKRMLQAKGACANQLAVFEGEWPDGVVPSLEACARAAALRLDLNWFVKNMLSPSAEAAYDAAVAPAEAAYSAAVAPACAVYVAACDSAWAAYNAACDSARAAYSAAMAPALWAALQHM